MTYIVLDAASMNGKTHRCEFYIDAAADLAVNTPDQTVVWSRINLDGGPDQLKRRVPKRDHN